MEKEYLILLPALINFLIGLFGFLKKKNKRTGTHFFIFTILITLWSFNLYFYQTSFLLSESFWLKTLLFLTVFSLIELVFFIIALSGKPLKEFNISLSLFFIFNGLIVLLFYFKDIANKLSVIFANFFLLFFLYINWGSIILLFKKLIFSHLKNIYILISFGLFITLVGAVCFFLPLISDQPNFFYLIPFLAFFLISFIALLVARNHLVKTKTVLREFSILITGTILLVLPFLVKSLDLKILTGIVFFLFTFLGYGLIKTIREESRKRKEAEKLAEERVKLSLTKDQFLLAVQHHLRTPLVPIKGYLEMILAGNYGREENPVIKEKLIEMKQLADNLYSLIENLLDIQELKTGKKSLDLKEHKIEDVIEGIIEELKPQAEEKGLYLKFEKISSPPIKLDEKKIREAIWNIIDNAIKYTIEGGITIKEKIENGKLKISISDTGIGMEEKKIQHFLKGELFERGERAKKLFGPGRGIGLRVSTEFIKAQEGKIWAESEGEDKGTTFWIELPLQKR